MPKSVRARARSGWTLAVALSAFPVFVASQATPAQAKMTHAGQKVAFDIPAQPLASALRTLARQGNVQILFVPRDVEGMRSPAVTGAMSTDEALRKMLSGTRLEFVVGEAGAIVVRPRRNPVLRLARAVDPATTDVAGGPAPQPEEPSVALQEIIVTAQKTEERLQDVPIAVSAFTEEALERIGVKQAADIGARVPNLTANYSSAEISTVSYTLRGIGQIEPVLTAEPGVGVYLDGIYLGRQTGGAFDVADIARIEVLRGVQGTLYGRNTTGGAINIITRKPSGSWRFKQSLSVGNFDQFRSLTSVDFPTIGGVAIKASYLHDEQDGYVDNSPVPGIDRRIKEHGMRDGDAFHVAATWAPTDSFSLDYRFDYSRVEGTAPASQLIYASPQVQALLETSRSVGGTGLVSPTRLDAVSTDGADLITNRTLGHGLIAEWRLSDALTIKSITGYRDWKNQLDGSDIDGNVILLPLPPSFEPQQYPLFHGVNTRKQHQISEELQLLADFGRWRFISGLYFFEEDASEFNLQTFASGVEVMTVPFVYETTARSSAAFSQLSYEVTPDLKLTVGARYTQDDKELLKTLYGNIRVNPDPLGTLYAENDWSRFNWMVSADYSFTDGVLGYAKVSTGYKSGGFNPRSASIENFLRGFDPEVLTAYEVGIKSELFGRRLRVNAAVFENDYDDLQVQQFEGIGGATSTTVNAGRARIRGFELEVLAALTSALTVHGGFGYLDPKYKEFLYRDPVTGEIVDVAGSAIFPNTAKTTANVGVQYTATLPGGNRLTFSLDGTYRSRVNFLPVSSIKEFTAAESRWLVDGRIALAVDSYGPGELEVALWGRNLFDEDYRSWIVEFGSAFANATYGMPRSYGLSAIYRY